jgi:crotonobetainyl-CoA:carnitine CoA-transferase CaiB-like acyl-CoA transferase
MPATATCLPRIRVLDMTRVFAGPWAAQMLADFGAEVIKLEHVKGGDDVRRMGLPQRDAEGRETGETSSYLAMNRGKRSVALDIAKPEGQAIARSLAARCDILIENFKAGGLARYGLDYESLAEVNPRLVYCSITGFGQDGPYAELPGYDPVFQAMSGLMSVTGVPEGEPGAGPALVGYSVSDINAGFYATIAILAALHHRDTISGRGQHIDLALLDAQLAAHSHIAMNYMISGRMPVRAGAASQITCPWQAFGTADRPIMIAVGTDRQFAQLCAVLGLPELPGDPRFATNRQRMAHKPELIPRLQAAFSTRTASEWMEKLLAAGISAGPINDFGAVAEDPQIRHRGMLREMPHPLAGTMPFVANPVKFSDTSVAYGRPPPLLGEHTREVLAELVGLGAEELDRLVAAGVIAEARGA